MKYTLYTMYHFVLQLVIRLYKVRILYLFVFMFTSPLHSCVGQQIYEEKNVFINQYVQHIICFKITTMLARKRFIHSTKNNQFIQFLTFMSKVVLYFLLYIFKQKTTCSPTRDFSLVLVQSSIPFIECQKFSDWLILMTTDQN